MRDWIRKRVDGAILGSIALHLLLIVGGLISYSFSAKTLPQESIPVDIVTASEFTEIMKGAKSGKQENPKPRIDKVGEEKINDDIGKVSPKPPVKTETAPPPQPKVVEKPPEPKVEPPKPPQPKQAEKQPTPPPKKVDPIGDLAEKTAKQPPPKPQPPKQEVKAAPKQQPKQELTFEEQMKRALIDKRDPTREANAGDAINANSSAGTAKGVAASNSGTWAAMFKQQVERCWRKPVGGIELETFEAIFAIRLKSDGTLEAEPVPISKPSTPLQRAYQDSGLRAFVECQPYRLPSESYSAWKFFELGFKELN